MLRRLRKSSGRVTLVLVGVAAIAGCGEERRDVYASREDCLADWGNKPEDCTPARARGGSGFSGATHYYGPSYRLPWWRSSESDARGTTLHSTSSVSSHSVSRGGFGSTAHGGSGG